MSTSPPIVPALSQGGTVTGNLTVTGSVTAGSSPGGPIPELVATTGAAGFALTALTPTILTWTAPADGNLHRAQVFYNKHVTSAETGGAVTAHGTTPDATTLSANLGAGGQAAGAFQASAVFMVEAGATVNVQQVSALTVGASIVWSEIWAS